MEIVVCLGFLICIIFVALALLGAFDGKSVAEQKREYLEKHGYPEKTVTFGDSQGRLGFIIGKEVYRKTFEHPTMKRIQKEIDEQGYSCPEEW